MAIEPFIGLMSATSMDGIDAALVAVGDTGRQLVHAIQHPWPPALATELRALVRPGADNIDRLGAADA